MTRLSTFLHGIRVLDVSRHLPGPLATLWLADMGAEVLKIEPPGGDELRTMGPAGADGRSVYFDAVNAGKITRCLDLKQDGPRTAFYELVRNADVLVESFRPGVMARLGVGYDDLAAINPRLIYCSVNGFGASGPLSEAAGHDVNYLAVAGALHHNGPSGTPFFDPPVADCAGSLFAALAIVGALHGRLRDGRGTHIDLALADAVMPLQLCHLAALARTGASPQPGRELLNGGAARYRVYETADGRYMSLGALEPKFWRAFCVAAGRPEWETRHADPLPQTALIVEVAAMFRRGTLDEWRHRFADSDCCCAPVLVLADAVESPRVQARGLVRRTSSGELQALFPARVDGERPALRKPLREQP